MPIEYVPQELRTSVTEWLKYDKNDQTRGEVLGLIESENWDELHKRFDERIRFGTSGLRAKMEAGFNRMNTLTVIQASQGLAKYIKSIFPTNLRLVIGHDHRFHSKSFAEVTIAAFLQSGFEVYYLNCAEATPSYVHTPLVPFAIENILSDGTAACGVMITASHNPKMDNGYKVYFNNGCQIIPPHDGNIAKCIEESLVPWARAWDTEELLREAKISNNLHDIKESITQKYLKRISTTLLMNPSGICHSKPWFVYTPMHGVGNEIFEKVAALLNLQENRDYLLPLEQKDPDPLFPTVPFPNPEEKGALDLALSLADNNNITLVIANDPDADRFSAAVKGPHGWTQLTGNQIGFLFALHQLEDHRTRSGKVEDLGMLASTVSSQMLSKMASIEGFSFEETLTGFKWLGNCARDMERRGFIVPYAFEESIGYMFTSVVHDKDGVVAAIVFLQMYQKWKKEQLSIPQVLQNAYEKYGTFAEFNGYYRVPDPASTARVFGYIRNEYSDASQEYPSTIGDEFRVTSFRDLTMGYQSDTSDNIPTLPVDASSHMITCVLKPKDSNAVSTDCVRFTIRGSGTEPKLKVYIEGRAQNADRAQYLAKLTWDVLRREWFQPERNGLTTSF